MSAVVVYLAEVNEVTHLEVAQYTIEQFLSDVGGAAGLFMGMSLATVLGTCDFIFLMIFESICAKTFGSRTGSRSLNSSGHDILARVSLRVTHWINAPIALLNNALRLQFQSARNSQMETLWRPKYLDLGCPRTER